MRYVERWHDVYTRASPVDRMAIRVDLIKVSLLVGILIALVW